jgi:hypothetical protein
MRRLLFLIVAAAGAVAAQDPPTCVGRLNYVSGSVSFQPGGVNDWVPATINRPLTVGDQLYADAGARAEIHVPGTALRIGSQTAFEFMNLDDRFTQVRLSEGTLNVRVYRLNEVIEIDTPNLAFAITRPGEYRIDTNPDTFETFVTVRDGQGEVTANAEAFSVHAEEQAMVTRPDGAQYNIYRAPGYDDFDNWALARDRREDRARSVAARYASPDMVGYEDLDQYGYWRNVPEYGRCWVPRDTPVGWAPYHDGHWAWVDPWGWTWVDDEPWGFAPFHYGRWAYFEGFWGWVPGPVAVAPVYAPALVAWVGFGGGGAFGASFGFGGGPAVGWLPLGPRDVYLPAYGASQAYISRVNVTNTTVINNTTVTRVYNNYVQTATISPTNYMNRTAPGAVVAIPQNALANARPVQQVAIKVQPNQVSAVRTMDPAPHVAPLAVSVLGHAPSGFADAPRPPATVLSKAVVAKSPPPPAPAPFQQRQALLARNPGYPIPIQQQEQIARATPATARPPVNVVTQTRTVAPSVSNVPAPRPPALASRPSWPAPAAQTQNALWPGQPEQRPQTQEPRPYEPPSVQPRRGQQEVQPDAPPLVTPPQAQSRPMQEANRPYEPPAVQERRTPTVPPDRPSAPPPRVELQSPDQGRNRSAAPSRPQDQPSPQREQARPTTPPRPEARQTTQPHEHKPASAPRQNEERD